MNKKSAIPTLKANPIMEYFENIYGRSYIIISENTSDTKSPVYASTHYLDRKNPSLKKGIKSLLLLNIL